MPDSVEEKIGHLTGSVESLRDQIHALLQTWQVQDNRASEDIKELRKGQSELKAALQPLSASIAEMQPTYEKCRDLIQNAKGGIWVLGILGSIALTAVGFMLRDLWAWASHLLVRTN